MAAPSVIFIIIPQERLINANTQPAHLATCMLSNYRQKHILLAYTYQYFVFLRLILWIISFLDVVLDEFISRDTLNTLIILILHLKFQRFSLKNGVVMCRPNKIVYAFVGSIDGFLNISSNSRTLIG